MVGGVNLAAAESKKFSRRRISGRRPVEDGFADEQRWIQSAGQTGQDDATDLLGQIAA